MKNSYIYANGQILCQYEGATDPDRYFYIHDRLGSVRLVVNDAADVNNSYTYGPFGEPFASECTETVYNPFLFTGQWYDSEIQQYYLRARQYSPYLGRFTSRDPVRGKFQHPLTLHEYLYCVNDPVNRTDPGGKISAALLANPLLTAAALYSHGLELATYAVSFDKDAFWTLSEATFKYMPVGMGIAAAMPWRTWTTKWKWIYVITGDVTGVGVEDAFGRTGMSRFEGLAMDPLAFLVYSGLMYSIEVSLGVSGEDMEDFANWHGTWYGAGY